VTDCGWEYYLRRMCLNATRSEHRVRVRRRRRELLWNEQVRTTPTPETTLLEREHVTWVLTVLSRMSHILPPPVIHSFMLCDVRGLSAPAAAVVLRRPEGTVRTWLRRARTSLRKLVDEADASPRASGLRRSLVGYDHESEQAEEARRRGLLGGEPGGIDLLDAILDQGPIEVSKLGPAP
jgi:hypothetical protein